MADEERLSDEEFESLSPSDQAHYRVKGTLGDDAADALGDDATKTARAAAFDLDPIHDPSEVDLDARRESLENAKSDAGVTDDGQAARVDETTGADDGIEEGDTSPQTVDEAVAAEQERREDFSDSELAEAEQRDRVAADTDGGSEAANTADIQNLGSTDPENVEDEEGSA